MPVQGGATATAGPTAAPTGPAAVARAQAARRAGFISTISPQQQAAVAAAAGKKISPGVSATGAKTTKPAGTGFSSALKQATAMASTDITGQIAPLQSQIGYQQKLGTQEQQTVTNEFNQLMPYAQSAAAYTGQFNTQADNAEQQIFQQAGQALNAQQQNASAQAQQMAQQTGAPVAAGTFTDAITPYDTALGQTAAVGSLNSLQLGTLGTDQAAQFAGQVLPAMAIEQHATIRNQIADQIQKLKDQITTIQGTKSKLIDARLPALLTAANDYQLKRWQLSEQRWKDRQTAAAQSRVLDQADVKLALEGKRLDDQWAIDKGNLTVKQQGNILKGIQIGQQGTKIANDWNISVGKLKAYIARTNAQTRIAEARNTIAEQKNVNTLLDFATGGSTSNKPTTVTLKHYLTPNDPLWQQAKRYAQGANNILGGKVTPPHGVYWDNAKKAFYTFMKRSETPAQFAMNNGMSGTPMSDPNALYRLITHQYPDMNPNDVADAIRARLGIPNWQPGQPLVNTPPAKQAPTKVGTQVQPTTALGVTGESTYNPHQNTMAAKLAQMPLGKLTDLAVGLGFKPSPRAASKQQLIDFIYHASGAG